MQPILVGVDAGGSKTIAAVARANHELARALGVVGAVRPGRAPEAGLAIAGVVREALSDAGVTRADALVVGAAGAGREPERSALESELRKEALADRVVVTTDIALFYAAAFGERPGVVLAAGTGSIAEGRDAAGRRHRAGGYGWVMGDGGSGSWIGRRALATIAHQRDSGDPSSALESAVLAASGAADFDSLVRWSLSADATELAALVPAVVGAAASEDPYALAILDDAAAELVQLVRSVARHLAAGAKVHVALAGGLLAPHRPLRERVLEQLRLLDNLVPMTGSPDAVAGALKLAEAVSGER